MASTIEKELLHKFVADAALKGKEKAVAAAKADVEARVRAADAQVRKAVYSSPFFWLLCAGWLSIAVYLGITAMDPKPFERLFAPGGGVLFNISCVSVLLCIGLLGLYHCKRSGQSVDVYELNWLIRCWAEDFPLDRVEKLERTMADYPEFNLPLGPDGFLQAHSTMLNDFLAFQTAQKRAAEAELREVQDSVLRSHLASEMRARRAGESR